MPTNHLSNPYSSFFVQISALGDLTELALVYTPYEYEYYQPTQSNDVKTQSLDGEPVVPPEDFPFGDPIKMTCLLCQRQFQSKDDLKRHNELSELHKVIFTWFSFLQSKLTSSLPGREICKMLSFEILPPNGKRKA